MNIASEGQSFSVSRNEAWYITKYAKTLARRLRQLPERYTLYTRQAADKYLEGRGHDWFMRDNHIADHMEALSDHTQDRWETNIAVLKFLNFVDEEVKKQAFHHEYHLQQMEIDQLNHDFREWERRMNNQ